MSMSVTLDNQHQQSKPGTVRSLASVIKIEHTVFSLPFALLGMTLAADGLPHWKIIALILLALTAARTTAMTFNRIVDLPFDRENPRTVSRELVTGALSALQAITFTVIAATVFTLAAFALNETCGWLSFPTLALVMGYSFAKRFTALSHLILGLALGISPGAAWLAVGADVTAVPVILGLIVILWVSGFDIIYSLADAEFDSASGLHSIPAALGPGKAIVVARALHTVCLALMVYLFVHLHFPLWSLVTLTPTLALFVRQHMIISANDLSRLNLAFFTLNGWIGFLFCGAVGFSYFAI